MNRRQVYRAYRRDAMLFVATMCSSALAVFAVLATVIWKVSA